MNEWSYLYITLTMFPHRWVNGCLGDYQCFFVQCAECFCR